MFKKLFCRHDWEVHATKTYEYEQEEIVPGTEYWFNPKTVVNGYEETVEVLICKKCGDIKIIKY